MGNMDVTDRSQFERSDLGHAKGQRMMRVEHPRALIAANLVFLVVGVALTIAAIAAIDSWAQWVVLGAILTTFAGMVIALNTRMN